MTQPTDDSQERIIEDAVQRFVDAQLRGREPDVDEYVGQYPQLAGQIRRRIQNLQRIDTLFADLTRADESDFGTAMEVDNLVGRKVGDFEITEMIGRGGMGIVYLAHDTKLDRSVAVKTMPPGLGDDPTPQTRFAREAKVLASLNHPNIAVIHDIIEQDKGSGYLILEYVPGETLSERIAREPPRLKEALSIAQQIAEAVAAAYENGVVHRDIKPSNIKITPEGRVKVLDFGLAKGFRPWDSGQSTEATQPGRVVGTPTYMSPEQARGDPIDHRTDVWSFGCVMYQMLAGRLPFEGQTASDVIARVLEREP